MLLILNSCVGASGWTHSFNNSSEASDAIFLQRATRLAFTEEEQKNGPDHSHMGRV